MSKQWLIRWSLALALVGTSLLAKETQAWIVFDASSLAQVQAQFEAWGTPFYLSHYHKGDEVAIAKVNSGDLPRLTHVFHDLFNRCGGYTVHSDEIEAHTIKSQLSLAKHKAGQAARVPYTIDNPDPIAAMNGLVDEELIVDVIEHLSSFQNRFYNSQTGVDAAHWLRDHWTGLTSGITGAQVALFPHSFIQPSVILTIPGSEFPDEVVIVGGHLDSTNGTSTLAPGADDDASGIASLTEVIRVIADSGFVPKRTLQFIGYAGEEAGLLGSRDIATDYFNRSINVVGVLQLDMTNYQGSPNDMYLIDDYTNLAQNGFVTQLVQTYLTDLTIGVSHCGYGCSDHYAWYLKGYPSSMPFEARMGDHNPTLHSTGDTIAVSGGNAIHAKKFSRLGVCFVAELAKGEIATTPAPDHNATLDLTHYISFQNNFGICPVGEGCGRDLDGNGTVDQNDLNLLYPSWANLTCLPFLEGPACTP